VQVSQGSKVNAALEKYKVKCFFTNPFLDRNCMHGVLAYFFHAVSRKFQLSYSQKMETFVLLLGQNCLIKVVFVMHVWLKQLGEGDPPDLNGKGVVVCYAETLGMHGMSFNGGQGQRFNPPVNTMPDEQKVEESKEKVQNCIDAIVGKKKPGWLKAQMGKKKGMYSPPGLGAVCLITLIPLAAMCGLLGDDVSGDYVFFGHMTSGVSYAKVFEEMNCSSPSQKERLMEVVQQVMKLELSEVECGLCEGQKGRGHVKDVIFADIPLIRIERLGDGYRVVAKTHGSSEWRCLSVVLDECLSS
jgi:hypothetical protein